VYKKLGLIIKVYTQKQNKSFRHFLTNVVLEDLSLQQYFFG